MSYYKWGLFMNNDLKKQFEDKYPEWILLNHGDHKNDPCVIQHQCGSIKEYDSLSPFFQKSSPHCDICEFKKKFPNMKVKIFAPENMEKHLCFAYI